ncbi:MAG TPA: glycerophosphodiester phosphodiesterase [Polyangiaceae bacterium]
MNPNGRQPAPRHPRLPSLPRLYAHRGAAAELPENTVPSFRRALELGADCLETDAHLTRDGHVVLSHDPTGARMCGVHTAIADATLADVQSWDASARFDDPRREVASSGQRFRIPTLEEALTEFPGVPFNVDAKAHHPVMVRHLVDVIRKAGAADRTLIASFDAPTLREARRLGYEGKVGLAQSEVLRLLALPRGVLGWLPFAGAAAQIPYRAYGIDLGTRAVVAKCRSLGLEVHYWTVNDPALAVRLLDAGADAIMTDDPRAIFPTIDKWRNEHALA